VVIKQKQKQTKTTIMSYTQNNPFSRKSSPLNKDDQWIQGVNASINERGTEGVCTGDKFGGPTCEPGTKRYNLAKTFKKMAKDRKGGPSRESSQEEYMPIEDDMHKKGEGDMGMSRQPWGGNKHDYKRRDVDGVMKKTGDVDGHYKDYEGPSRKSSSPVNHNMRDRGTHIAHSHKVTDKDGNPKVYKNKSDKHGNESFDIAEQRYRPRDTRSGKKEKSISRKSSPLNNTGMTGLNYSKELRYNAVDDITQGKGEADYGFSRESSSPLDYGSWAHEDAMRDEDLYKKGDYAHARALGIDEHDADYAKHWHKDEAEHGPSRSSSKLRKKAMKLSGAERGDEYDYENPRVQRLLRKANRKDERSGK
jgi:hypothetical protein